MELIKILYLIDKLDTGGTQANLLEILKHLDRRRFQPSVIALTGAGDLMKEFQRYGIRPVVLSVGKAYGPDGIKTFLFLKKWMRREGIQIIQTFFLHAEMLGLPAAAMAGVRHRILTKRDEGFWLTPRQAKISRWLCRFGTGVLTNSNAVKKKVEEDVKKCPPIHVIHNGVDTLRFAPSEVVRVSSRRQWGFSDSDLVVGVIANMKHEIKGHRHLIDAAPALVEDFPNVRFLLVGDGPLRKEYENKAAALGISRHVRFAGARRDAPQLINGFDIACLPSLSEGFSNFILESMSVGKPVVAANVGGNPELIEDGVTGFLIPPANAKALEQSLRGLLSREPLRRSMGEAGRNRILQEFRTEKMSGEYEKFYLDLMNSKFCHSVESARVSREDDEESSISFVDPSPAAQDDMENKRIRIAFLIWSLDLGGAEQVVMNLARHLDRKMFDPLVICLNDKGRYAGEIEKENIPVLALHKRPKLDLFIIPKLVSVLKKEKVDLMHTHLFTANLWGRIAAKWAGVPVIVTEHNLDTWKGKLHLALDRILIPWSRRIVFVCREVEGFYRQKFQSLNGKCRVLYNGIERKRFEIAGQPDLRRQLGIPSGTKVIGIVGRLVPQKAHADFLKAMMMLVHVQHRKDVFGLIVGDGELRGSLDTLIHEYQLQNHVLITGFRKDCQALYPILDVFVLCSLREGFPMTILEAMSAGVPVIATNVGGVAECITDGVNGILVTPGDYEELARSILKVLQEDALRSKLISNGKEKVKTDFSVEQMVQKHEQLYWEVLKAG